MSHKSFFSLLLGLAAGAAIGILYAPDKGKNTREKVKRAAAGNLDDLQEGAENLEAEVEDKAQEAKEDLKDLGETLKKKGAEIKEGARALLLRQLDRLETALRKAEDKNEPAAEAPSSEEPEDQTAAE
ncbi:MAG: YtxH domain-containing protein [Bacteroidales bacterium]|nr:YtxH domain-containing protein [Bacteroidales bacterium]